LEGASSRKKRKSPSKKVGKRGVMLPKRNLLEDLLDGKGGNPFREKGGLEMSSRILPEKRRSLLHKKNLKKKGK